MENFTLIVPAFNEIEHIPRLLRDIKALGLTRPPIIVDNASSDATASAATNTGGTVLSEPRIGKGFAVHTGANAASTDWVFLCDADIEGLSLTMILELMERTSSRFPVGRLALDRPTYSAPVTELVARPMLEALGITGIAEPLGGLALVDRRFLLRQHLPGGWGFDVALTIAANDAAGGVPEIQCAGLTHRTKPLSEYGQMAREVINAILRSRRVVGWDHRDCVLQTTQPGTSELGTQNFCTVNQPFEPIHGPYVRSRDPAHTNP